MLVDHADAVADGVGRRVDGDNLTVEPYLAFVLMIKTVEDLHQRALARPVLAQQGVNLARAHVEIDTVVRQHAGEPLGDAAHLHMLNARMAGGEEVGGHSS